MDLNKQNQAAPAQDSDDLIAELARLVAQDARSTSARSDAYRQSEPALEPEPQPEPETPPPAEPEQQDVFDARQDFEQAEAAYAPEPEPASEPPASPFDFDFGFGTAAQEPQDAPAQPASADPIADLIADAEVEAYARDTEQEESWTEDNLFDDQPGTQPQAGERDPLSEIEALIGEAAQVGAGEPGMPRRVKSSFLDGDQTQGAVDAAESAILAATAAAPMPERRAEPTMETPQPQYRDEPDDYAAQPDARDDFEPRGHDGFIAALEPDNPAPDTDFIDEEPEPAAYRRPRRGIGAFVLPVVAGTAILALLGGGYFLFFAGSGDPGDAPVLMADAEPLKEVAEQVPTETTATESVVFNEIEGNTTAPEDEALVSRDQTEGARGSDIANVIGAEEGEIGLANRPVRTVTVRPDGTIVQAEDSVAGSAVLPVDRPDVPEVPNSTLTADPIGEAIAQAMAGDFSGEFTAPANGAALAEAASATEEAALDAIPATGDDVPAVTAADANSGNDTVPLPIPRPAGLDGAAAVQAIQPAPIDVASTEPVAQTPAAPAPAAPAQSTAEPAAWVQLSSQRSEDVARAGMAELQARYGSLFNGVALEVSRVDLGERGIYYRVRLPQPSLAEANAVCGAIQGQGGDCFVLNN